MSSLPVGEYGSERLCSVDGAPPGGAVWPQGRAAEPLVAIGGRTPTKDTDPHDHRTGWPSSHEAVSPADPLVPLLDVRHAQRGISEATTGHVHRWGRLDGPECVP